MLWVPPSYLGASTRVSSFVPSADRGSGDYMHPSTSRPNVGKG
jgi:hypothetical protein